ncbi:putative type II DNA modification enzyme [Calothrix sp. NIES-4101]|nr:putative type II DNA modification enzyme [Calothrix sp. NIES-4101]
MNTVLTAIQIEGNILAADITSLLSTGSIKGQQSEDFGLAKTDKLADEIATAWGDAKAYWAAFQRKLARLPEDDTATTITREWGVSLLESLGYKPVLTRQAEDVDGQSYAISHRALTPKDSITNYVSEAPPQEALRTTNCELRITNYPPIHIVGCRLKLDQRPPSGIPRLSAHGLVQEYLNKTEHLWAITTNGYRWRLLRDSSLMTRLSYVEFDLEQILNGENFAEFGIFYRLFHRSRLPEDVDDADKCLLEFYHQETLQQGGRVRDKLRDGVEEALRIFGNGFIQHPDNEHLRQKFSDNYELRITNYELKFYRQLLRLIYRLLFLMVAEARELLLIGEDVEKGRIYREYYSVERLRRLAEKPSYRREGFQDLWRGLCVTFKLFDENWRGQVLGLSPLNGDLFGSNTLPDIDNCAIDNYDLLQAIKHLSLYVDKNGLRRVNYASLDVEELGSVYESLLDFHPQVRVNQEIYEFVLVYGSDRKTTGSFYTPPQLVQQLIKTALEPVIQERLSRSQSAAGNASPEALPPGKIEVEPQKLRYHAGSSNEDKEKALLSLKIVDPACGSGHFLLAAARRIGKELARVRTGETEPGKEPLNLAIRDVIQNCIYGVDLNPLAVDLCKVALWIEGFYSGMPLNFLDHRIKCGNSLVGVLDLEVLKEGIPDEAYKAVTGDNKTLSTQLKKRNKKERENQGQLTIFDNLETERSEYIENARVLGEIAETTPQEVREKQARYKQSRNQEKNPGWWRDFSACNLWTAAFFMGLTEENLQLLPTSAALSQLLRGNSSTQKVVDAANKLAEEKRFFHWCLEFSEVFEQGGFDCVLGNPPWERIKLQEKEFFASRSADIANAANKAAREKLIKELAKKNPELAQAFDDAKHDAEAQSKFIRESARFPLTAVGDINTYAVFAETTRNLISTEGRVGVIVPTGIATDDTCKKFFGDLTQKQALASLYDFENKENLFPGVGHGRYKFSLISISGKAVKVADLAFFLTQPRQLENQVRIFQLSSKDIALMNPNTLTCPVLRTSTDAELTKKIYQHVPVVENERTGKNSWSISFMRMFDMANDSGLFKNEDGENLLPLYEAKMFWYYNHRFGDYADYPKGALTSHLPDIPEKRFENLNYYIKPRYWVSKAEVENRLASNWNYNWLIAFRNISNATNERTAIFSILPKVALAHSSTVLTIAQEKVVVVSCLLGNFSSLVFDFVTRQKMGGTNFSNFILKQLPLLPPEFYTQENIQFITPRVLELVYTAWDMQPFAKDMGYDGEPFIWNSNRRAILRAELDAYYAKLYGLTRDELRYILDPADVYGADFPSETFRVLKNNEIKQFGEYRTQRLVLEAWDRIIRNS